MPKSKLIDLILDYEMYPRNDVSSAHVSSLFDAILAGETIPPVIADRKSKRVVDGFHRIAAHKRLGLKEIEVVWRDYKSDADMFADAVRMNSAHGRPFDSFDKQRAIQRLIAFKVSAEEITRLVHVTAARVEEYVKGWGENSSGQPIVLKRGLLHQFSSKRLTKKQVELNDSYSGMQPAFHANQLVKLLEAGVRPKGEGFAPAMDRLCELWGELKRKSA